MILKNSRAPLLFYFKLCASFHSNRSIQPGIIVRKRPIRVKINEFFVPGNLEISQMTLKNIGHLFYATSSFVHHFIPICEFKLELQSENAKFGSNRRFFVPRVTLKFDRWPWKTIGHTFYATSSCVHRCIAISELKQELQSGNAQFTM